MNSEDNFIPTSVRQKKAKSAFHNFQKHLISLLRRFIHIRKDKIAGDETGVLADALWTIFIEAKAYNKKILNLVFGSSVISQISFQQKG